MSSYNRQKTGRAVVNDMQKFSRTAKRTKQCNISPKPMRGGIRL